jgi:[ribosomal protein S18]-alanine N-acetyltransferase
MPISGLEIRQINSTLNSALRQFFAVIKESGDEEFFHPHPFDSLAADRISSYTGPDLYYAMCQENRIIGYGMLRGWDAGYEIPSLGIIIHPEMRRSQLGSLFMNFLQIAARLRGATKIRLKVYPENRQALSLYQELGYVFESEEDGQLVGIIDL